MKYGFVLLQYRYIYNFCPNILLQCSYYWSHKLRQFEEWNGGLLAITLGRQVSTRNVPGKLGHVATLWSVLFWVFPFVYSCILGHTFHLTIPPLLISVFFSFSTVHMDLFPPPSLNNYLMSLFHISDVTLVTKDIDSVLDFLDSRLGRGRL